MFRSRQTLVFDMSIGYTAFDVYNTSQLEYIQTTWKRTNFFFLGKACFAHLPTVSSKEDRSEQ